MILNTCVSLIPNYLNLSLHSRAVTKLKNSKISVIWNFSFSFVFKPSVYYKPINFQFYFRREVLEQHKSDGLNRMGPIKPALALCVFSVFVLVYFSLWKGVRSTGKVIFYIIIYKRSIYVRM